MKSQLEILEETLHHYKWNDRGIRMGGYCVYETDDGSNCAVGRCISKDTLKKKHDCTLQDLTGSAGNLHVYMGSGVDLEDILKDEYKGHHLNFWRDLQKLHDEDDFWSGRSITESGLAWAEVIKQKITNGDYNL